MNNNPNRRLLEKVITISFLLRGKELSKWIKFVDVKDYVFDIHRKIARAVLGLARKDICVDLSTVINFDPSLSAGELAGMIAEITDKFSMGDLSAENIPKRIKQLKEINLIESAKKGEDISTISQKIDELSRQGLDKLLTPEEVVQRACEIIEEKNTKQEVMVKYPFKLLNGATRGIHKGQMIVVAGRPSVGKSVFLQNMALTNLLEGKSVLFATAEMSIDSMILRFMSQLSGQNLFYKTEGIKPEHIKDFWKDKKLFMHQFTSTHELEEKLLDHKIDIIYIDYLQILTPKSGKFTGLNDKTSLIVGDLVDIKNKFDIPVVCASQFNRNAVDQPSMADLYQSGKIEQAADVIISLYRDKDDKDIKNMRKIRIDLLKNRNGMTFWNGSVKTYFLWFDGNSFSFCEDEKHYAEEIFK